MILLDFIKLLKNFVLLKLGEKTGDADLQSVVRRRITAERILPVSLHGLLNHGFYFNKCWEDVKRTLWG